VFAVLGPHWAGRSRFQGWYQLRGQCPPVGQVTGEPSVLVTRIAATLDPSESFRTHLLTMATLASDRHVRRAAVQALATGWRDHPDTLPLLHERATDPDGIVRQARGAGPGRRLARPPH
jgi:hypothetical protein